MWFCRKANKYRSMIMIFFHLPRIACVLSGMYIGARISLSKLLMGNKLTNGLPSLAVRRYFGFSAALIFLMRKDGQ